MKKMKCPSCEKTFEAETSKEMLNLLNSHYMSDHKDILGEGTEEQKNSSKDKFNKNWEEAEEIK